MNLKDFFRRYKNNEKKGFTVIEVLAVVVILSITSTAIVSVFMAVHKSVRETGTITSEQFHITQVERFIRNEFQVASNIDVFDIDPTSFTPNLTTTSRSAEQDDECMVFNPARKCVYFKKYDADAGEFKLALTV
ncbi:MAG: type II secretion system protein, partial [Clostridia bacterium]|nr:type II secretion system protein [Clostridia bacterium]